MPDITVDAIKAACVALGEEVNDHCAALARIRERLLIKAVQTEDEAEYLAIQEEDQMLAAAQHVIRTMGAALLQLGNKTQQYIIESAARMARVKQSHSDSDPI